MATSWSEHAKAALSPDGQGGLRHKPRHNDGTDSSGDVLILASIEMPAGRAADAERSQYSNT